MDDRLARGQAEISLATHRGLLNAGKDAGDDAAAAAAGLAPRMRVMSTHLSPIHLLYSRPGRIGIFCLALLHHCYLLQ